MKKKIKNHSLICAVTVNKIIHYEIHNTSVDSEIFYNYINNLIKDNKLEDYYFFRSPNNNPIEIVFSIIKNKFNISNIYQ